VAKAVEAIEDQLLYAPDPTTQRVPIWVIIPIIVTTAELWRLKVGITVEDVRGATDITAIADHHDVLVLWQEPDHQNKRDTRNKFKDTFNDEQQATLDGLLKQNGSGLPRFITQFTNRRPCMFIVISYKRLKVAMRNLHSFFGNDRLIKQRKPKPK